MSYGQTVRTMAMLIMANYELSYGVNWGGGGGSLTVGKIKLMLDVSLFISRGRHCYLTR